VPNQRSPRTPAYSYLVMVVRLERSLLQLNITLSALTVYWAGVEP